MAAVYICDCEHPKSQHKRERDGCRAVDCGCAKFEADLKASAEAQGVDRTRVLTAVAEVCEDQAAKARAELAGEERRGLTPAELGPQPVPEGWSPDGLSTSPRRAEAERDAVGVKLVQALRERGELVDQLAKLKTAFTLASNSRERNKMRANKAEAELVSARQELAQLRAALGNTAAAYVATTTATAADVVYAYDAWSCLTEGGCGSRYTMPADALEHRCGPLTPVRVTITHQPEGQQ